MRIPDMAFATGRVELRGFVTPPGIVLDSLTVESGALAIANAQVSLDEPARFRAVISDAELTRFVAKEKPGGLREILIRADGGMLEFTAVKTMLIEVRIRALIRPIIVNGDRLELRLEEARAMGVGVGNIVETQIEKANPILEAKDLKIPARFTGLTVDSGFLVLDGTVDAPDDC